MPEGVVTIGQSANGKLAEAVARRITQSVVASGLRPGELVGTEPELIKREKVSRAVLCGAGGLEEVVDVGVVAGDDVDVQVGGGAGDEGVGDVAGGGSAHRTWNRRVPKWQGCHCRVKN
jgi:hypothetical protein